MDLNYIDINKLRSKTPKENLELLEKVLNNEPIPEKLKTGKILEYEYGHPYYMTILQLLCCKSSRMAINVNKIEELLDSGADRYSRTELRSISAWHFAASSGKPEILRLMWPNFDHQDINSFCEGDTALHRAIKYRHDLNQDPENTLDCIRQLVEHGINVNQINRKNETPILIAAEKEFTDIVEYLIHEKRNEIDLDSHTNSANLNARNIIVTRNLYTIGPLPGKFKATPTIEGYLTDCLMLKHETEFVNCLNKESDQRERERLSNLNYGNHTFLQYATLENLQEIVRCLLKNGALIKKVHFNKDPPIYTAAQFARYEIGLELLRFCKDNEKLELPQELLSEAIIHIDPKNEKRIYFLEEILDRIDALNKNVYNYKDPRNNTPLHYASRYGSKKLVFGLLQRGALLGNKNNYKRLACSDINRKTLETFFDECISVENNAATVLERTITFNYRSLFCSPPNKTLDSDTKCKHTIIDVDECEEISTDNTSGMDVIYYMSKSAELNELIKHPLITSFLFLKWQRIKFLYKSSLFLYILFYSLVLIYVFYKNNFIIKFFLALFVFVHVIGEIFRFVLVPEMYFKNFENFVGIITIVVLTAILFLKLPHVVIQQQSAILVLLMGIELTFTISKHPMTAENMVMLTSVLLTFLKFFTFYVLIIISFSTAFYLFFCDPSNSADNNRPFRNIFASFYKTLIMLNSESEISRIPFKSSKLLSRATFIVFIFLICFVLLNLLNGLAVNDTNIIRNDAQSIAQKARINYIYRYEKTLSDEKRLGHIINLLNDRKSNALACKICKTIKWFRHRLNIFPTYLKDCKLVLNEKNNIFTITNAANSNRDNNLRFYIDSYSLENIRKLEQRNKFSCNYKEFNCKIERIKKLSRQINEMINIFERNN